MFWWHFTSKSDSCTYKYCLICYPSKHTYTHWKISWKQTDIIPAVFVVGGALLSSNCEPFHSHLHWWISTGELHDSSLSFTQKVLHLESFKDIISHLCLQESRAQKLRKGKCLVFSFCCDEINSSSLPFMLMCEIC